MIALLATGLSRGRVLARRRFGFVPAHPTMPSARGLVRTNADRDPVGFLATRPEHLAGHEISGFIVLEPVDTELLGATAARVRRAPCGRAIPREAA
jgi:hypothetical protein